MRDGTAGIGRLGGPPAVLWLGSVLFFGVGDVVTTSVGLRMDRVVEAGPVVAPLIEAHGTAAMILLKLGVFGVCCLAYRRVPVPSRLGIPLGLAAWGALVSAWNLLVIARALG